MLKKLLSACALCLLAIVTQAQELNCRVTVLGDKIAGVDQAVFTTMEKSLTEFMNTRKWTNDDFGTTEKIDCNVLITLSKNNVGGDIETYQASISIQAVRPVYNASYTSTIVNYVDKDLLFKFSPFNPVRFDDNQVVGVDAMSSNLPAVLAYYAYLILAMDYDSFSPMGGTVYMKKAQNIVNNAPEDAKKSITGWKSSDTRSRYWLVDQMLNNRFQEARNFWYTMHREGLDSMYVKPIDSRNRILNGIKKLYQVNRENPSSVFMQFIFNAKGDEMLKLLASAPKQERAQYITLLSAIDVPNAAKYNALK